MGLAVYPWQENLAKTLLGLRDAMPNGVLLHGPRGLGTFEIAQRFAQGLLCEAPGSQGEPCGHCHGCRMAAGFNHPDLYYVISEAQALAGGLPYEPPSGAREKKQASREILVHQLAALPAFLNRPANEGGWRVVLVYPADQLGAESAASLLKSLEEPPAKTVFVLVADSLDAVLPTIRSRCRLVRVAPPARSVAAAWLAGQGLEDAEGVLAACGGLPLLALHEDPRTAVPPEARDALLALLREPRQAVRSLSGAFGRDVALPGMVLLLARWASDLARVSGGLPPAYFRADSRALEAVSTRMGRERLWAWTDRVTQARRVAEHPLNARLALEDLVLEYVKAAS